MPINPNFYDPTDPWQEGDPDPRTPVINPEPAYTRADVQAKMLEEFLRQELLKIAASTPQPAPPPAPVDDRPYPRVVKVRPRGAHILGKKDDQ